ncbi:MBL fold metallo-hydrolase [Domibacillus antri]|uniref:MBL fold metallo-hydrolase n=1 Tax=Domibacillus antri TaxID=1714264 RepID=A0A1Q8Q1T4_9BACI|nr:MBL fold metallo-hydrolase [Domibacillus antri]OLN21278.1 MBL fold metallo-hydrolase [Domibacillus antri]
MAAIQQIDETIYRAAIPVPFPMKYVYCYLLQEQDSWTIVDTGLKTDEAIAAWEKIFSELNIRDQDVRSIILTHFHPDHFGMSGWLQKKTGAPVYMSEIDIEMADRAWGTESQQPNRVREMFLQHGTPGELAEAIEHNMKRLASKVRPLPKLTPLPSSTVEMGRSQWEIIEVPGHTDGIVCFYEKRKQYALISDHVLDKITPNISLWPGCAENPLRNYMRSLERVQSLEVKTALTAHGELIMNLSERADQIISHHEKRLSKIEEALRDGQSAYDIAVSLFHTRSLSTHQWRFAIAEVIAHLEYLAQEQRVEKEWNGQLFMYKKQKSALSAN